MTDAARAVGTIRASAVKSRRQRRCKSLATSALLSATASATADVSEPPRPSVVASPSLLMPWKPATMATLPSRMADTVRF